MCVCVCFEDVSSEYPVHRKQSQMTKPHAPWCQGWDKHPVDISDIIIDVRQECKVSNRNREKRREKREERPRIKYVKDETRLTVQ